MVKQEKLDIIKQAIVETGICRCSFSYDGDYFYYYPNAVNEKFILGQRDDEFLLDGYTVRKISHLRRVERVNGMHDTIYQEFGIAAQVQNPNIDITSWQSIFLALQNRGEIVIIEDEIGQKLVIGKIQHVFKNKVYFLDFDVDGVWNKEILVIPYSVITSVQWNTRYTAGWKKYLKV